MLYLDSVALQLWSPTIHSCLIRGQWVP